MHLFVEAEMLAIKGDRRVHIVDDVANLNGGHSVFSSPRFKCETPEHIHRKPSTNFVMLVTYTAECQLPSWQNLGVMWKGDTVLECVVCRRFVRVVPK